MKSDKGSVRSLQYFSPSLPVWSEIIPENYKNGPPERTGHCMDFVKDKLVIFGGSTNEVKNPNFFKIYLLRKF